MTTIIGTIVQIGDDETGQPRLVIRTERSDLKKIAPQEMFTAVKITIEAVTVPAEDSIV